MSGARIKARFAPYDFHTLSRVAPELRVLDLRDAELVNLEPVTCLRQLRKLLVSFAAGRCLKGTLEPLADCPALEVVSLGQCPRLSGHLGPLGGLRLSALALRGCWELAGAVPVSSFLGGR